MTSLGRTGRLLLSLFLFLFLVACPNPEGKSQEIYETAQFEEQQNNFKHARKLYEEIVRDYPATSFASKAKERLSQIEGK